MVNECEQGMKSCKGRGSICGSLGIGGVGEIGGENERNRINGR